jgi:hypothetical protein
MIRTTIAALIWLCAVQASAIEVEGFDIAPHIPAHDELPAMQLQGIAVRHVYGFVETYVGALYLQQPLTNAADILATDQARRMMFHVLSSRVSARRFTNAIEEGLALNLSEAQNVQLKDRVQQLVALFDHKFSQGTIGYIEWLPASQQTRIVINGEVKGTVPGKDLNDALLSIWIGEKPVSDSFRDAILDSSLAGF